MADTGNLLANLRSRVTRLIEVLTTLSVGGGGIVELDVVKYRLVNRYLVPHLPREWG